GVEKHEKARVLTTPEHYAYLKIADGCYNKCTYCLIPKIRGKYHSYPMQDLVEEAVALGETQELIIVAQDVTRYGEDLYGKNALVELLQKLSALENIRSIRLLYCYPDVIGEELIAEIKHNPKIIKYIDIPLQHSEDRVLKLMNRKGKRKEYLALLEKLRREIPEIAVRSTFICGFPGETEEEHEQMISFVKEAGFVNCGFFAYSREPDTAAARMKGQIHHATKKRRVKALYEVQKEISAAFLNGFIGKRLQVVCDGIDYEKNCFVGRAYFNAPEIDGKVYFNAHEAEQGETYEILVSDADCYDLYGKTEDYTL
ncbi:MAG: MiaB/RimO family radical SAM methylthiotransferase, partial [Clostridia bacterium]|nr:MiaB/RimO family radical SAM methylthiotransferase [Clostridia bacterium]